ncbi:hypothetical protein VTH06DRAFT_1765 [Thermothelomyces fergusii]
MRQAGKQRTKVGRAEHFVYAPSPVLVIGSAPPPTSWTAGPRPFIKAPAYATLPDVNLLPPTTHSSSTLPQGSHHR